MITNIKGIRVGHATDRKGLTGCTVILCDPPMIGGVDVRGSAPATRETNLLRPMNLVQTVNAIVLSGGSSFGLDCVSGVMKFLEEMGQGVDTGVATIPIVPAAALFDLAVGDPKARPDAAMGYEACKNAGTEFERGSVGAGTGATVGKYLGMEQATKSGIGTASIRTKSGLVVAAIVAVNAFGDVINPKTGEVLAGVKNPNGKGNLSTLQLMMERPSTVSLVNNTTIGVVATNAFMTKEEANKMAQMAHDGYARAIAPIHTMYDGDTVFALGSSKGSREDMNIVGSLAAEVMALAIIDAVKAVS